MRCERCGVELTNKIIKINDVAYCENCARLMGYGKFLRSPEEMLGSAFSPFDEIASTIMQMSDLDFGNSALSCPKCGMTLRDFVISSASVRSIPFLSFIEPIFA